MGFDYNYYLTGKIPTEIGLMTRLSKWSLAGYRLVDPSAPHGLSFCHSGCMATVQHAEGYDPIRDWTADEYGYVQPWLGTACFTAIC
jgi:hypothetical protein